jgi:glycosyltransferase involved in cell wall biosynthesis
LAKLLVNEQIVPKNKIKVLGEGSPNGVDFSIFKPRKLTEQRKVELYRRYGLKIDQPVIGFVGRLTADKGLLELAEAFSHLSKNGVHVQLLVIGSIDDSSGENAIKALRQTKQNISVVGYQKNPEFFYPLMDIFCLPSRREGLPTVVLESMASKVLVVGSNCTGNTDIIIDDVTGLLFDIGDSESLYFALTKALNNRKKNKQIVEKAYVFAKQNFEHRRVISSYLDEINRLFSEKNRENQ